METFILNPDGSKRPEEDFSLFLEELAHLLNKYHYGFEKAKFVKIMDEDVVITEFVGDSEFLYPVATVPKNYIEGDESE